MVCKKKEISFKLNGKSVSVVIGPMERLTAVLRDKFGLTGTKVGCEAGDCGSCTVLIEGVSACACMVPAGRLEGQNVTTVEGLDQHGVLSSLQRSFLHFGAAQCGICTPGMLLSAEALLKVTPRPTEQEVKDALGGVLCRCTGYRKIIKAVMSCTDFEEVESERVPEQVVGTSIQRLDGVPKVNGTDIFGADDAPDDALVIKLVRSPFHHAQFEIGDMESYIKNHPGVVQIFTAHDIPGENTFGVIPDYADQPVFAEKTCRFKGEAIAAIVGEDEAMKRYGFEDFPVVWNELLPVLDAKQAMSDDAPQLYKDRGNNILVRGLVQRGNLDEEFSKTDIIAEDNFETGFVEHAYIEPEAGFARRVGDCIEVQACSQTAYMDRDDIARIIGIKPESVRIIPTSVGGGFGSKLDLSVQPYMALASWHLNRPVKIVYSRTESMISTTKRHPSRIKAKIAATSEGHLVAMDFDGIFNTGAYASWGPTVANRVPVHASGPYCFPAYRARSVAVHTHCAPAGAFRGFGVPQAAIAQECLFDELADAIGMDRLDFRIKNALQDGDPTVTGQVFESGVGYKKCLTALIPHWQRAYKAVEKFNAQTSHNIRRGVGVAGVWYGCGNTSLPNPSTIKVGITKEGRVMLHQGAIDIGQGSNTVITQICADAIGINIDQFELISADTAYTKDAGKTSASRQTFVSGKAAYLAGKKMRSNILDYVKADEQAEIDLIGSQLIVKSLQGARTIELRRLSNNKTGYVFSGEGTYDPPTKPLDKNGQGEPYASFGYGAHMIELEVDTLLGTVNILKVTAAHDVGRAINPIMVEGQVEGGIAQGIGLALMEEFIPGKTENLHDYLIPTFGDVPLVETIIIEESDPHGPFGAKGLGEHVLIPTAPAILNAICHATGARIRKLPATPERILTAIQQQERKLT